MSYGGQQGGYGEEEVNGGMEEQYGEEGQEEYGQEQQHPGKPGAPKGGAKGGAKAHKFPDPNVAAQYYAKATAGNPHQPGAQQGAMSNHTEEASAEYSYEEEEEEEQYGYEEHSNMQMQQHGKGGRAIGGSYEDDQHHQAVMKGMEGLYNQGWTEEHKKSAAHIAGYTLGVLGKWIGFY